MRPIFDPPVPAPYVIGAPNHAAAMIVDNDQPRPPTASLTNHLFHVCLPGTNGFWCRLECSTNLINWTPVCTNLVTDGAFHFIDCDATNSVRRFYRTLPEANPPAE